MVKRKGEFDIETVLESIAILFKAGSFIVSKYKSKKQKKTTNQPRSK